MKKEDSLESVSTQFRDTLVEAAKTSQQLAHMFVTKLLDPNMLGLSGEREL